MTDCKGKSCRFCSSQGIGFEINDTKTNLGKLVDRIERQTNPSLRTEALSGKPLFHNVMGLVDDANTLTVVGGRPSSKHFYVAEAILFDKLDAGVLSAVIGSETGNLWVLRNYLAEIADIRAHDLALGSLSDTEWIRVDEAITHLAEVSNFCDVSCNTITVDLLISAIVALKTKLPELGFVLVSADDFTHPFEAACGLANDICWGGALRYLVDSFEISIVVTTALSEAIDNRIDHQTTMKDLPGHLNLLNYSDVVALCEYPDMYEEDLSKHNSLIKVLVNSKRTVTTINIPVNEAMMLDLELVRVAQ